jgi:hypothetical protein
VPLDGIQDILGDEVGQDDHSRTDGDCDVHRRGHTVDMRERNYGQHALPPLLKVRQPVACLEGIGDQVAMTEHYLWGCQ